MIQKKRDEMCSGNDAFTTLGNHESLSLRVLHLCALVYFSNVHKMIRCASKFNFKTTDSCHKMDSSSLDSKWQPDKQWWGIYLQNHSGFQWGALHVTEIQQHNEHNNSSTGYLSPINTLREEQEITKEQEIWQISKHTYLVFRVNNLKM